MLALALHTLFSARSNSTEPSSPAPASSLRTQSLMRESGKIQAETPLSVVGQTERFRDIEEIGRVRNSGKPISGDEQRRWE